MEYSRLANVIFQRGEKIHQAQYDSICESIETDKFTLSEHVADYKHFDSVLGKNIYLLEDGSKVLVSRELIEDINKLNINKDKLVEFMSKSENNFKKTLSIILDNNNSESA